MHGYDIVNHGALNPEIGSAEDYDRFVTTLHEHDLGLILDIVPNHMAVATDDNPWWNDVLENGPASRFASHFDIAWKSTPRPELQDKVLLPVLGEPYGDMLESGRIRLDLENGAFFIRCQDRRFPVAPRSTSLILEHRIEVLEGQLGAESSEMAEYRSIATAIGHLPDRTETDPARVVERHREAEVAKRRLGELVARCETVGAFLAENLLEFNGTPNVPRSFDRLDELLSRQCYRLSFWRVALEEINYRRFFDVNDLAALGVERPQVFDAVHGTVVRLVAEGKVDGLRVDHPDGLYDPRQYFQRLQRRCLRARGIPEAEIEESMADCAERPAPRRWPLYIVAEKILAAGESLREDWAVAGTTGYDFLNAVNGLFVDGAAEPAIARLHRELTESADRFPDLAYRSRRLILAASLAGELNMLAHQLDRLAQKRRRSRDFTLHGLRSALREVIGCFPVYRSYISPAGCSRDDCDHVEMAVRRAAIRNPLTNPAVFRFIRDMLLLEFPDGATDEDRSEQLQFVGKFQQVTSPVMAKGLEDTAFYIYTRLISLNEVGGHPDRFGVRPDALHAFFAGRRANWPRSLSPLSTHDTKRSEDVRARINVLSERPDEWGAAVRRWMKANAVHRVEVAQTAAPDANEEYLFYQTLVGAWPPGVEMPDGAFVDRIVEYMTKALHEAKIHTSWVNPNDAYDAAVQTFVRRVLHPETGRAFLDDFVPFQRGVARHGAVNSLSQTLLKIAAPGVADTYQGTELPDFSLVDPDNRRPVDFHLRREMLRELDSTFATGDVAELARTIEDGRAKLYVTWRALTARRDHPGLFAEGEYLPLAAEGAQADRVFAFARRHKGATALVAVPRLTAARHASWPDCRLSLANLEAGTWRDVFTGRTFQADGGMLAVNDLLAPFPVSLLIHVA